MWGTKGASARHSSDAECLQLVTFSSPSARSRSYSHFSSHPLHSFPADSELMTMPQGEKRPSLSFYNQIYRPSPVAAPVLFSTPLEASLCLWDASPSTSWQETPSTPLASPSSDSLIQLDLSVSTSPALLSPTLENPSHPHPSLSAHLSLSSLSPSGTLRVAYSGCHYFIVYNSFTFLRFYFHQSHSFTWRVNLFYRVVSEK